MSVKNLSILTGASVAATGGTALAFVDDGTTIPNGIHLTVPADTDYATRRQATLKVRNPKVNPVTLEYGKDKKSISIVQPQVLTSGRVVFNTLRIEREIHPDMVAADVADFNRLGAQLLVDADLDLFWTAGSLS